MERMESIEEYLSKAMAADLDVPWFVAIAAEPLMRLREAYPSVNISSLPPLANPVTLQAEVIRKRSLCYDGGSGGGSSTSSNNGVLIGAVVGAVVGTLLLAALLFFLWRRRQRRRAAGQPTANTTYNVPPNMKVESSLTTPAYGLPPPVPFVVNGNNDQQPTPTKKTDSTYFGSNPTSGVYSTPSVVGDGSVYGQGSNSEQASYYNYAPPPPVQPSQQQFNLQPHNPINPGMPSGTAYYAPNNPMHPTVTPPPSSIATPPPPSSTPGALSSHSGSTSYAPWAMPIASEASGSSVAGPSTPQPYATNTGFMTAQEEKAHYSGYHPPPPPQMSPPPSMPPPSKASPSIPTSPSQGRYGVESPPPEPAPPAYAAYTPAPR
ncbi:hypothetical protein FS842_001478 [Serendipita sp. 407]|nr:hypothetical protein FS842_001478 [Serendipita sp. 407]